MVRLKKRNMTPPGGWKFKDDSTFWIQGNSIDALISNVILHREKNGSSKSLDREVVEEEILLQLCSTLDETWCKGDFERYEDKSNFLKLDKITSIATAALEFAKGAELVSHDELVRRQNICKKCFLNKPAKGCACAVVYKTINASVPENRRDEELEMCGACGCMINAKIQLPKDVIDKVNNGKGYKYPAHCWQIEKTKETPDPIKEDIKKEIKPKPKAKKKAKKKTTPKVEE